MKKTAKKPYKVTRDKIVKAALTMQGWRFRHQARGEDNSVDCVGLLVVVGRKIKYPYIFDIEGYRRTPSANVIRETLLKNCDEIAVEKAKRGDFYLMRMGGIKPRHAAIRISDETDIEKGIEPRLIHAYGLGTTGRVVIEPVSQRIIDCVAAFRVRGVID